MAPNPRRSSRLTAPKTEENRKIRARDSESDAQEESEEDAAKKTKKTPVRAVKRQKIQDDTSILESATKKPIRKRQSTRNTKQEIIVLDSDEDMGPGSPSNVEKQIPMVKRRGRPAIKGTTKKEVSEDAMKQEETIDTTKIKAEEENDIKPRRNRKRNAIVSEEENDLIKVQDVKKISYNSESIKAERKHVLDSNGELLSASEESDVKPMKGARGKARSKKAPVPKPSAMKGAKGKGKKVVKKSKVVNDSDESSDFVASESSDESSDDDESDDWGKSSLKAKSALGKDLINESDDDDIPIKPKKSTPKAKASPKAKATPKPKSTSKTKTTPKKKQETTPKAQGNVPNGNDDGDDENTSEEIREYPYYECTYATSGRARCKTCEKTLTKGNLVISIQLVHSRFGLNTYFKHLECTLLNNEVPQVIHGLDALEPQDVERVQGYMVENSSKGIEDERVPLSDEHFIKRSIEPAATPSPLLTASLLPYQQEGLAWMKAQEASKYRGGILADEMGMGKTIQAISMMLENVKIQRSKGMLLSGGTLIVCPVIACMQWKSEIERFVQANHLSILLYHGPKRTNLTSHIASYDVVLTTYSIIESEGRKLMQAEKVSCAYCKKLFVPEKLVAHNKYFCGPNARRTAKQSKQKITKGKAAMKAKKLDDEESEDDEDDEEIPVKVSVPPPSRKQTKKPHSPLHEIEWTRIILDEAHYIKDKKCSTARSVFRLNATYRWCLTGTPLQNRIGELFSLVRFLQVDPFAYYECAECDCKQLDFSIQQGHCKHCEHTAMQHYSSFNKKIVNPIQGYGYVAEGKLAMLRLQNELLRHVLLRRTKESRADDISLPPKLVRVRHDALDEREKDFYESIYTQSKAQFNTYVSAGTLLNNYAHIFDLLIRLRQAVDHPYLVIYSKSNPALQLPTPDINVKEDLPLVAPSQSEAHVDSKAEELCGFCHEPIEQPIESACSHEYCRGCVEEYVASLPAGAPALCPTCEEPLTVDLSDPKGDEEIPSAEAEKEADAATLKKRYGGKQSLLRKLPSLGDFQSSTKIEALMEELHIMKKHDPSAKAIVFSQFVNMLDLIEHRLQLANIKSVKLSGHMQMAHRDRLLTEFRQDPTLTVFLISLKAGGVALNLTVASHIFLMDPWWNPAAEHQAIDRTHRLGQFKPIRATRFIIANTIEERIIKLQEKKQLVFEGTVGSSTAALARLTIEDLRFLFSG